MAKTSNIFVHVEPEIKSQAEEIFSRLGISMSNAVSMFLRQVIIQSGIPFELKLYNNTPLNYDQLPKTVFDNEIYKGMIDCENGRTYTANEVEQHLFDEDFNI